LRLAAAKQIAAIFSQREEVEQRAVALHTRRLRQGRMLTVIALTHSA